MCPAASYRRAVSASHHDALVVPDALLGKQIRPLEFQKFLELLGISE